MWFMTATYRRKMAVLQTCWRASVLLCHDFNWENVISLYVLFTISAWFSEIPWNSDLKVETLFICMRSIHCARSNTQPYRSKVRLFCELAEKTGQAAGRIIKVNCILCSSAFIDLSAMLAIAMFITVLDLQNQKSDVFSITGVLKHPSIHIWSRLYSIFERKNHCWNEQESPMHC